MKNILKNHWNTLLFFTLVSLIDGLFCGVYLKDGYPAELQAELLNQGIDKIMLGMISII